jgi:NitT/TauT family transport system substrate-binding protein
MRRLPLLLLPLALLDCHQSQSGATVPTVRIAIHRDPIAFLPVRVAQTLGYYQAEGIAVAMSEVAGGAKALEALLGGSVDVAAASMSDAVQLAAEGRDVRGFLVLYTRPSAALAVTPALSGTIRTIRDLKGRTVGVSTPGSSTHQFLNFLLVRNGLSPADVSTVSVGMSATSVAALEHGTVDAAVLLGSAVTAFEERHPEIPFIVETRTQAGARQVFGSEMFPSLSMVAQDRWLRANPEIAQKLVRAMKRGMRWVRDRPAEQVRSMIPDAARMTEKADLQAIHRMQQGISTDGLMPAGSAELVEQFVAVSNPKVRAAHIDTAKIYTNEFASAR